MKQSFRFQRALRVSRRFERSIYTPPTPADGCVGILALSHVGRRLASMLRLTRIAGVLHGPTISNAEAAGFGLVKVGLAEVFSRADVVSCHLPLLPSTQGLLRGAHFAALREGATFINTARGGVVMESEMLEVLARRPDLTAILDVTDPEPPPADSPLHALANVVLTPHIAGSMGAECFRLGRRDGRRTRALRARRAVPRRNFARAVGGVGLTCVVHVFCAEIDDVS